jgi:hypothetical protein
VFAGALIRQKDVDSVLPELVMLLGMAVLAKKIAFFNFLPQCV